MEAVKYYAKETIIQRQKLRDGTFFLSDNQRYVDDLFDESKIDEKKCAPKKPRVGVEYQVTDLPVLVTR